MCMMSSSGIETCLDMTKKVSPVNTQNYRHEQGTNSSRIGRINWKLKWYFVSKLNLTYCEKEMFRLLRSFLKIEAEVRKFVIEGMACQLPSS